jgi:hypothetical protein
MIQIDRAYLASSFIMRRKTGTQTYLRRHMALPGGRQASVQVDFNFVHFR